MKKLLFIAIVALSLVGGAGQASADTSCDSSAGGTSECSWVGGVTWE